MKIHIYYRHYNIEGNDRRGRPEWFGFESCFFNLMKTLPGYNSGKHRLNVVYDGNVNENGEIEENWMGTLTHQSHKIWPIKGGSDSSSFFQTIEIIKNDENIQPGDLIYLLENDYLHVKGWIDKVFELFLTYNGVDYVSLYDHNDKYFLPQYFNLLSKIIPTKSHHWRNTPSTCGSFIISKQLFDADYDVLSTMVGDHNKFLWLNEHRDRTVLTPLPGLSTHCMDGLLSPTIDWKNKL